MPIVTGDLLVKLSIKSGSAGNQSAQGDPNASLGKYISTTQLTDNSLHNLFDVVSGDENAAAESEYRCLFVHNSHASLAWQSPVLWVSAQTAGGADGAVAWDSTAASALASASAQALEVANEDTAPAGPLSFSAPTSKATGLAMGANLSAGQVKAFWIRRTTADTGAVANDGLTFKIEGDTEA